MYQFTEMFKELNVAPKRKNYRWRGFGLGLVLGWIPAWGLIHWKHFHGWSFPLLWILAMVLAYSLGFAIRK